MQRFFGVTQDINGNAIPAVAVTVKLAGTGTLASLYSGNDVFSGIVNPFTSNTDGTYQFYTLDGRYDITFSKTGFAFTAAETADSLFFDPAGTTTVSFFGSQNNWSPSGGPQSATWLIDNNSVTTFITGIAAPQAATGARTIRLLNTNSSFNTILVNNSGLSLAANRIVTPNNRDYVIFPSEAVELTYVNSRWTICYLQSVRVIDEVSLGSTISNSAAETTVYSKTISGGLLGTLSRLRLTLASKFTNTTGAGSTGIFRLKYGGTSLTAGSSMTLATAVTDGAFRHDADLFATGVTNGQEASVLGVATGAAISFTIDRGTSAIDSTVDQTLIVSMQLGAASNLLTFTRTGAVLEWLP